MSIAQKTAAILENIKLKKEVSHWKAKYEAMAKRCEAAERYIDESPCDPDILPGQIKAYNEWQSLKSK